MDRLYDIDATLFKLLDEGFDERCIDEETGEIDLDRAQELIEKCEFDRDKKLEGIALFLKELAKDAADISAEEKTLAARRKSKERKAEYLKGLLSSSLLLFNQTKFETPRVALSFRKSTKVEVQDESLIAEGFFREKVTREVDKKLLSEWLKSGKTVSGAALVEVQNLQIK